MKILIHSVILCAVMTACIWVAFFHPFWPATSPRDTLPRGGTMAILIFSLAIILRGAFRWSITELMLSVLWCPIAAFVAVGLLTGLTWSDNISMLNQNALFTMVVFIGSPFVIGVLLGSLVLTLKNRISRKLPDA